MKLFEEFLDILNLEGEDDKIFTGHSLDIGSPSVYGGQVLAQAIVAAYKTAPKNKTLHSLHSYFLKRGDTEIPIQYRVTTIRDGRSFSVRRVTAFQESKVIFILAASFHIYEPSFEHQMNMPNVANPDSLSSFPEMFKMFTEKFDIKPRGLFSDQSPIIFHPVEHYNPFKPGKLPARAHVWLKSAKDLPADQVVHQATLAYASDFNLLLTALLPHDISLFTTPMQMASLDHSMWFHRPAKADDWHLYVLMSPNAGGSRGFCTGRLYNQAGELVASVSQEGLIRLKNPPN